MYLVASEVAYLSIMRHAVQLFCSREDSSVTSIIIMDAILFYETTLVPVFLGFLSAMVDRE